MNMDRDVLFLSIYFMNRDVIFLSI